MVGPLQKEFNQKAESGRRCTRGRWLGCRGRTPGWDQLAISANLHRSHFKITSSDKAFESETASYSTLRGTPEQMLRNQTDSAFD